MHANFEKNKQNVTEYKIKNPDYEFTGTGDFGYFCLYTYQKYDFLQTKTNFY